MMTEYETELDALIKKIKKYAKTSVPRSRYEHSIRTAEMCSKLCSLYGLDENLGYLAGVAHDMCKNLDDERMLSLSAKDNNPITELEKEKPSLLHGRAAAGAYPLRTAGTPSGRATGTGLPVPTRSLRTSG